MIAGHLIRERVRANGMTRHILRGDKAGRGRLPLSSCRAASGSSESWSVEVTPLRLLTLSATHSVQGTPLPRGAHNSTRPTSASDRSRRPPQTAWGWDSRPLIMQESSERGASPTTVISAWKYLGRPSIKEDRGRVSVCPRVCVRLLTTLPPPTSLLRGISLHEPCNHQHGIS